MIKVVLDANAFVNNDWYADHPSIELLERAVREGICEVIVPEIVVQEVKNRYRERITDDLNNLKMKIDRLNGLIKHSTKIETPNINIDKVAAGYDEHFAKRLTTLNAKQPGYDDIPNQDIVARDLARGRPFQKSGKGYRDTILWETILRSVANDQDRTVLVTANRKDFCVGGGTDLHPDLEADCRAQNLSDGCVTICPDLETFVSKEIKPMLALQQATLEALRTENYEQFSFGNWFSENREAISSSLQDEIVDHGLPTLPFEMLESPSIRYIENPVMAEAEEAYELDESRDYLRYRIVADVTLDLHIYRPDFYWIYEEYPLDIEENDGDEKYIWASTTLTIPINLEITFNKKNQNTESFEVSLPEFYGWCSSCGAPIESDAAEQCIRCGKKLF